LLITNGYINNATLNNLNYLNLMIYYISQMKNLVLLCLTFFSVFTNLNAQNLTFEKLGIADGLPHYYIESLYEDSKGELWIGTVAGLVKYNGFVMKTYTMKDGLNSNNIFSITEDQNKVIWIGTDFGVVKYENDIFTSYILDTLNIVGTKQMFVDSENHVYAANIAGVFKYNITNDSFEPHKYMGNIYTRTIIEDKFGDLWFGGKYGLYKTLNDTIEKVIIPGKNTNHHNSIISSLKDLKGNLWFGTASGFVKYNYDSIYTYNQNLGIEDVYINLFQTQDSLFIFGTYGGGIVTFKNPNNNNRRKFDDDIVSNTIHDIKQTKGGTIWLATGGGLLKSTIKTLNEVKFLADTTKSIINTICLDDENNYWIGTNMGIRKYNPTTKITTYFSPGSTENENNILCSYSDVSDSSIYFGTYSGRCFKYKADSFTPFADEDYRMEGHSIYGINKDKENNIWLMKTLRVTICSKDSIYELTLDSLMKGAFEMVVDSNNTRWIIGSGGIVKNDNEQFDKLDKINNVLLSNIRQVEIDNNGIIWFGSVSNGVFMYNPMTKEEKQITLEDGLTSNSIQSMNYNAEFNYLCVGTIYGISIINLNNNSEIDNINNFTNNTVLNCNVNASFSIKNKGTFIAVDDKVFNYNPKNDIPNTNLPIVRLDNVQLFNRDFDFTPYSTQQDSNNLPQNLILPFDQNHLTFNFYGIEFNQPKNVMYSVKLEGFDTDWSVPNKNHSITYNNLPPNNYTFKIKAKNSDGLWSNNFEYSFTIDAPFYKKWWFIGGIILLIGLSIFVWVKSRIKKIKAVAEIEKNIAQLELKALRAQMNPHFIFNILNNIQNFVVNKNTNKAVCLLGEFAVLIRSILDISSDKTIVLSKEIEFLTTYINLDLTQYPNKYNYEFSFTDNIDTDNILIPPMLIQPFVENAILHGLMHKDAPGLLKISFSQTKSTLICVIEDNGIGRTKSKEISVNQHNHKSKALNISNDRINQFNTMEKTHTYKIDIIDLINENNVGIGTKVIIEMPLILKY